MKSKDQILLEQAYLKILKNSNILRTNYFISVNIDESCNLQCPTCRSSFMNFTNGKIYKNKLMNKVITSTYYR